MAKFVSVGYGGDHDHDDLTLLLFPVRQRTLRRWTSAGLTAALAALVDPPGRCQGKPARSAARTAALRRAAARFGGGAVAGMSAGAVAKAMVLGGLRRCEVLGLRRPKRHLQLRRR